jgi:CRP/FNR family transcriptional regulator, cyclic AMP receptor protein
VLDGLLMGSTRMRVPAGSVTHWEGEPDPHLELVVSGVVRVFVTAPDGRTMTVRYCRPGALIGVMSLFTAGFAMPATCGSPGTVREVVVANYIDRCRCMMAWSHRQPSM